MKKSLTKKFWKKRSLDKSIHSKLIITFFFILLLAACSGQENAILNKEENNTIYFIPPTLSDKASLILLDTPTPPPPSPTPICENDLEFIKDVTIDDDTEFAPGEKFEKIWKVKNAGTCNWESGYTIQFIPDVNRSLMGVQESQVLFPARSGAEVDVRIVFTAPTTPGGYQSNWQAFDPSGNPFGKTFWVRIIVNPNLLPTTTPIPESEPSATP